MEDQAIDVMDFIFDELHYAVMERKVPPYAPQCDESARSCGQEPR
jgi:hypothetical protein